MIKKTATCIGLLFFLLSISAQEIDSTHFSKKYYHRKSVYEAMPNKKGEIIFLGNSITEQGTWRELFQNNHIINRGIGGDVTDGVLYRLDEVTTSHPDKIFLLIGTNDLRNKKSPRYIIDKIHQIIVKIKNDSPYTDIYLESVLPTYERNERPIKSIKKINKGLKKIAKKEQITYIDLFLEFIDKNTGELHKKYSLDGLHFNGKGYVKWKSIIEKYVNDNNSNFNRIIRELKKPSNNYVLVAAHRGDWRNAPENSLQSLKNCIKMGVDIMELDLQITKDNVVVIMHDNTIDRTTNGTGKIIDYTYKELQRFVLKDAMGRLTRNKIPTLKEMSLFAKGKIVLNLDIKKSMPFKKVASVLRKANTVNQTVVRSYRKYKDAQHYYGSILDSIIYIPGMSKKLNFEHYFNDWENGLNPTVYAPKFETDTEPIAQFLKTIDIANNGIWLHSIDLGGASRTGNHDDSLSVIDPENGWGWLIKKSVDIIQTDRPFLLLEYLRSQNLHN